MRNRHKTRYAHNGLIAIYGYGVNTFSLVSTAYKMLSPVLLKWSERHLIGDFRLLSDHSKLLDEAVNSESKVVVKSLGLIGKVIGDHFAIVVPSSRMELVSLLNRCDKENDGRCDYQGYEVVSRGKFFFSATGSESLKSHNKFKSFINLPTKEMYFKIAEAITLQQIDADLKTNSVFRGDMIKFTVRNILAKILLGTETPLSEQFHCMLDKNSFDKVVHIIPAKLRLFGDSPGKYRKEYQSLLKEFFETQAPLIQRELKANPEGPYSNFMVASLVEAVHMDFPKLQKDEFSELLKSMSQAEIVAFLNTENTIKSLPLSLIAGDTLFEHIYMTLNNLHVYSEGKDEALQAQLREEAPFSDIDSYTRLECHRKEGLRHMLRNSMMMRYTSKGFPEKGIPPRTHVKIILNPLADDPKFGLNLDEYDPLRFDPNPMHSYEEKKEEDVVVSLGKVTDILTFSAGSRMCPAFKISEYIYCAVISTILKHYDFDFGEEDVRMKRHVRASFAEETLGSHGPQR